jgi:hypothetical protein
MAPPNLLLSLIFKATTCYTERRKNMERKKLKNCISGKGDERTNFNDSKNCSFLYYF